MTYRIPENFGQLTYVLNMDNDSQPMVCTIGVGADTLNLINATALVAAMHASWGGNIMPSLPNQLQLIRTELRYHSDGQADDDPFSVAVAVGTVPGANVGASVPQNTALLVHKRTSLGGRQGRGRLYIPAVMESVVSNTGILDSTYRTDFQAGLNGYTNAMGDIDDAIPGAELYLFHNLSEGELIADLPTEITSMELDVSVATQRRRLR